MKPSDLLHILQEMDDDERIDDLLKGRERRRPTKRLSAHDTRFLYTQDDSRRTFEFTYQAALFEQGWLLNSLGEFYEQRWISDVLRKIKTGKEASVYLCRSGERLAQRAPLAAVKVYRPRMLRNLRNDSLYRQGRAVLDEQGRQVNDVAMLHAVINRTHYGEKVRHQSWISYEYSTLQTLHDAGADVPCPFEMAPNAILMSYFGDEALPAPTLNEVDLAPGEAAPLFERLLRSLDILLACRRVHGDLSAYNILYWDGAPVLIDFPQVILPDTNRSAYAIFERDMLRLCAYFISQGLALQPRKLAADLWQAHNFPLASDIDPPPDRQGKGIL